MSDDPGLSNSLADLAARINAEHAEADEAVSRSLAHAMAAGDMLNEAKALVAHGQWLPWLKDQCRIPQRTAQHYMRLAKHRAEIEMKSATVANLTVRAAARLVDPTPSLNDMLDEIEAAMNDATVILAECDRCEEEFGKEIAALAIAISGRFFEICEALTEAVVALDKRPHGFKAEQSLETCQRAERLANEWSGLAIRIKARALVCAVSLVEMFDDEAGKAELARAMRSTMEG
jgi:hypothetical protein